MVDVETLVTLVRLARTHTRAARPGSGATHITIGFDVCNLHMHLSGTPGGPLNGTHVVCLYSRVRTVGARAV